MSRKRKTRGFGPRNARERADQLDAFAALAPMRREGLPASLAAKAEGVSVRKIRKYVGSALRKRGNDYVATPSDRLLRPPMVGLDAKGTRPIVVRSSKAGEYLSCA